MAVTKTKQTIHMTAQSDAVAYPLKIAAIIWAGCTTAGHICEIKDDAGSGNILFKATGTANGSTVVATDLCIQTADTGISITDLDSGYVTLYLK